MRRWQNIALGGLVLAAMALAVRYALGEQLTLQGLLALLRAQGGSVWAVPLFLVLFVLMSSLMLPAVALFAVAGVTWGFGPGMLISWVAANLGANLQFWVARRVGQERVVEWLNRRGFTSLNLELQTAGLVSVVMLRQVPLPFAAVNAACGASPLKWRDFALGNAIGLLTNSAVYTWFASSIVGGVEGAEKEALFTALSIGAGIIVVMIALRVLSKKWLAKRSAK